MGGWAGYMLTLVILDRKSLSLGSSGPSWAQGSPPLSWICSATLDTLFSLHEPQFPQMQNGDWSRTPIIEGLPSPPPPS